MKQSDKPLTITEFARLGGRARAAKYSHEQLSKWSKRGGWPKGKPRKPAKSGK